MKRKLLSLLAAGVATVAFVAPANAAYLHYVLTGDYTADWYIDLPASLDEASSGTGIGFYDVDGLFPSADPNYYADVRFYNGTFGGGFTLVDHYSGDVLLLDAAGAQLYSGDELSSPKLLTGSFSLVGRSTPGNFSLTVSQIGSAVPEPESWALMLLGFGVLGCALRARVNRVAFS